VNAMLSAIAAQAPPNTVFHDIVEYRRATRRRNAGSALAVA